jgi:hypothetical protein
MPYGVHRVQKDMVLDCQYGAHSILEYLPLFEMMLVPQCFELDGGTCGSVTCLEPMIKICGLSSSLESAITPGTDYYWRIHCDYFI